MTTRKSMMGLMLVCALLLSAFTAANASAEGTTTFTCKKGVTPLAFSDPDCESTVGTKEYGHEEVTPGLSTETVSTSTTSQSLTGTIAGVPIEIVCTADTANGKGINNAGPPMNVAGSEIIIAYTGCTVTKPINKGCTIKEGKITTNKLKASTSLTTSPKGVKFVPEVGEEFVGIVIEKCSIVALNGTFPVKGSQIAVPNGATLSTSAEGSSLTFAGNPAVVVGTNTVKNKTSGTALVLTPTNP